MSRIHLERRRTMELDAIRFCIGPWNGRYSSMWRIWSNPGDDNVYLGVSALLQKLKFSLHETGKFRAAFVEGYNQELMAKGKNPEVDRAFLKWEKAAVTDRNIMQALDIHFPLPALSLNVEPAARKRKKQFFIQPEKDSLGKNDTITVKILFHRIHPYDVIFARSLKNKGLTPVFFAKLHNDEFVTVAFGYSKKLPFTISEEEKNKYGSMLGDVFGKAEKKVGDRINNLTLQIFQMGFPPSIYNFGNISAHWISQDNISINVGLPN